MSSTHVKSDDGCVCLWSTDGWRQVDARLSLENVYAERQAFPLTQESILAALATSLRMKGESCLKGG